MGRVMIDPAGCDLYWPDCPYAVTVTTRVDDHAINNEDRLICSPMVFGFSFEEKVWSKIRNLGVKFSAY